MRPVVGFVIGIAAAFGADPVLLWPGGSAAGWNEWAPRAEIAPETFLDTVRYRSAPNSLAIHGAGNPAAFGGWECLVRGVRPGRWYRFAAWYRATGLTYEPVQVVAKLKWVDGEGKAAGFPDFPFEVMPEGGWTRLSLDAPAPAKASGVKLQLLLANAPEATVWWDDISLDEIAAPPRRLVTVATVKFQPRETGTPAEAVRKYIEVIDRTIRGKTDLILLGETITWAGVRGSFAGAAEPVPGPTTDRLAEVARRRKTYLAAGLVEREGTALYNTAVLIDRAGRVAGKYRKVNLPFVEAEGGLTPGNGYPVFQTDFGKVGMMICWDSAFADPARSLALQGAELILAPIWTGNQMLIRARALESRVFLITSGYGYDPSLILDPDGRQQAAAAEDGTAAVATIDLNRRYDQPGLGNVRQRIMREMRVDVPVKRPGFVQ
jgi:predicted amidohydrolase